MSCTSEMLLPGSSLPGRLLVVIKLKSLTPISSGPIEGSDLYDLVEECEDPKNVISSLLNTLG